MSKKNCSNPHPEYCSAMIAFEDVSEVVEALCGPKIELSSSATELEQQSLPSREVIIEMTEDLRSVLFPGFFGNTNLTSSGLRFTVGALLEKVLQNMQIQVMRALCFAHHGMQNYSSCSRRGTEITRKFLAKLPKIRHLLQTDVQAAYEGDPALTNHEEAIFCYPGIQALTWQRIAHELYKLEVPLIPRIITEHAHSLTGIDIHPGARIGEGCFIDHGTGVVIGETAILGSGVRIYQGVTLGAKSFPLDENGKPIKGVDRHPIVEDRVVIYSGATILGRITLGEGAVIGGNVWLTRSVPKGAMVTQVKNREEKFENGSGI